MTQFTYTGTLMDIGLGLLIDKNPVMTVRPEVEAYGLHGLVSAVRMPVTVRSDGWFSMSLMPSGELTPAVGGPVGVPYIIEVARFETAVDGSTVFNGLDVWRFTAVAGGGAVSEMAGGSVLAAFVGPPWPSPLTKGLYIDKESPNAWGVVW